MDTQVADLLGGERVLGASVKSNLDLARATRQGLPAETAAWLADAIGLPAMGPLGALIGFLPHALSRNASPAARLTPEQSDIVIRTASTLAKAIDTLGDRDRAAHWLTAPNRALGGEIPITLLDTSAGAHEVEALLDRIEYGVYS
jgi:putative toxin-antitoxin system antitoxin component (TIGR02293 family)